MTSLSCTSQAPPLKGPTFLLYILDPSLQHAIVSTTFASHLNYSNEVFYVIIHDRGWGKRRMGPCCPVGNVNVFKKAVQLCAGLDKRGGCRPLSEPPMPEGSRNMGHRKFGR